jgi:eukaryotic-like serine/threonine-protein kinase
LQSFTSLSFNAQGEIVARKNFEAQFNAVPVASGIKLELVQIPAGSFDIGSFKGKGYDDERPQNRVSAAAFMLGQYAVTQAHWQAVMGKHSSRFNGDSLPVDNISWNDAVKFCERLSKTIGQVFKLPSEAQWEYACRAGSQAAFHFGETMTTDVANYNGEFAFNAEPKGIDWHVTTPVDTFDPNAFGLCDMHGNVWEWCADVGRDTYDGAPTDGRAWTTQGEQTYRVARGGCWHHTPDVCRSAARLRDGATEGDEFTGFRVVMDPT